MFILLIVVFECLVFRLLIFLNEGGVFSILMGGDVFIIGLLVVFLLRGVVRWMNVKGVISIWFSNLICLNLIVECNIFEDF